jgi:hypothetical protein
MKATAQKLRKLKTKQVYGFKKESFNNGNNWDPTLTTITSSQIMAVAVN